VMVNSVRLREAGSAQRRNRVKRERNVRGGRDSQSRKCQTFAMCGTGSDSKAANHVSMDISGAEGRRRWLRAGLDDGPAKSYKECGH
jgi:hypothetical protein